MTKLEFNRKLLLVQRERDALKARLAEYIEQANQGVMVSHDCPAMFACAFIVADNAGHAPAHSYCQQHMAWHGDCQVQRK